MIGAYGGTKGGFSSMNSFGAGGGEGGIQNVMKIAKMFM